MKATGRLGLVLFLLFFTFMIPGPLLAQKEEPPSPPSQEEKSRAAYHDFDDILIPSELTLDKKNSFVYGTTRSNVGILIFEGRVDPSSLSAFFRNNMQKDGWRLLSSFKYRDNLLNFLKEDRSCVITIKEKTFKTIVEVRVGPIEGAANQSKGTLSK